jgi:hypothetical protein
VSIRSHGHWIHRALPLDSGPSTWDSLPATWNPDADYAEHAKHTKLQSRANRCSLGDLAGRSYSIRDTVWRMRVIAIWRYLPGTEAAKSPRLHLQSVLTRAHHPNQALCTKKTNGWIWKWRMRVIAIWRYLPGTEVLYVLHVLHSLHLGSMWLVPYGVTPTGQIPQAASPVRTNTSSPPKPGPLHKEDPPVCLLCAKGLVWVVSSC